MAAQAEACGYQGFFYWNHRGNELERDWQGKRPQELAGGRPPDRPMRSEFSPHAGLKVRDGKVRTKPAHKKMCAGQRPRARTAETRLTYAKP
jgi:hypothetical protein